MSAPAEVAPPCEGLCCREDDDGTYYPAPWDALDCAYCETSEVPPREEFRAAAERFDRQHAACRARYRREVSA